MKKVMSLIFSFMLIMAGIGSAFAALPPTVTLTAPNSGTFKVGNTVAIQWSSTNQHHYSLELYKGTASVGEIDFKSQSTAKSFSWLIPSVIYDHNGTKPHTINGSDYKIKVAVWNSDGVPIGDLSNSYLTITPPALLPTVTLTAPDSGTFKVGNTVTIQWSSTNQHHYSLELYKGTSAVGEIDFQHESTAKSFSWVIPSVISHPKVTNPHTINGSDYKIKVAVWNSDGKSVGDSSNSYLTITSPALLPTVTLTAPDSGTFKVGNTVTIQWSSTNQHHYSLELYKGTSAVEEIDFQHESTAKSFSWVIPSVISHPKVTNPHTINGSDYKIKVAVWNSDGKSTGDSSNSYLTITPAAPTPTVDLISPNSGSFKIGDTVSIQWSSANQHHYSLELCTETNPVGVIYHDDQLTSSKSFTWKIPYTIYDKDMNLHIAFLNELCKLINTIPIF